MNQDRPLPQQPAPCIIDSGIVVNKDDIKRLLNDLGCVRYVHSLDGQTQSQGEGWILEVFTDPYQSTLVANGNIYINLASFDYLHLNQASGNQTYFDLMQDNRQLRLIPLSACQQEQQTNQNIDAAAIEAMVTQVLSAKWDVQFDDEDGPF